MTLFRRRAHLYFIAAFAALCLFIWLVATPNNKSEVIFKRGLIYGKGGDADLLLDLAMPKAGIGPLPVVVFLHGKGWRAGDRSDMSSLVEGIARLGYVGVAVGYRLVPKARFPAQVEDCKAAIRWIRAHASEYRIDPRKIGVVGFSAGGYLAAMLGTTIITDGLEGSGGTGEQSSEVRAVVSFFGPTDFTTRDWPADLETEVIVPFLGGTFADKPDNYLRASPINFVKKVAVSFLFFHGAEDVLVPVNQSMRLAEKLRGVGVPARVIIFEREGHGFSDATNQVAMKQMLEFLAESFAQ